LVFGILFLFCKKKLNTCGSYKFRCLHKFNLLLS
jgi:hypothetical protein